MPNSEVHLLEISGTYFETLEGKRVMNNVSIRRSAVLTILFFVVGVTACSRTPESSKTGDATIVIRFRGLMVFDQKVVDGKLSVRMGVDPHDHHRLSIQLKGPDYGGFIEWADAYDKTEHFELEVKGGVVGPSKWEAGYPFDIAILHPTSAETGELVIHRDFFHPTFTVNQAILSCTDPTTDILFSNDDGQTKDPASVPREVVATITLAKAQIAFLKSDNPKRLVDLGGQSWEILVRNSPSLESAMAMDSLGPEQAKKENHFQYYYEGLFLKKDGEEKPVPWGARYRAEKKSPPVFPTRPCIPISFK